MQSIIQAIDAEALSYVRPDLLPFVKLKESKKIAHIEPLKAYIPTIKDHEERGHAYGALGFLGLISKKDQSAYILDQLEQEKNKKAIEKAFDSMKRKAVPIYNNYQKVVAYFSHKYGRLRESAIVAAQLCTPDWLLAEQAIVDHYMKTSSKSDKFWCVFVFEQSGTKQSLPALRVAVNEIKDSDGFNFILMAANKIEPAAMTQTYIDVLNSRKDSFTKKLAMKGLYLGQDLAALDVVLERAQKILKRKSSTPEIDYVGSYSELQAAFMYLQIFEDQDERIPSFLAWAKAKRLHYMDNPTRAWAEENL